MVPKTQKDKIRKICPWTNILFEKFFSPQIKRKAYYVCYQIKGNLTRILKKILKKIG